MCSITSWHFQYLWLTPNPVFKVTAFLKWNISKRRILGTKLLKNTNRKPYTIYRMIPLSMTLSNLWPHFKVAIFLKSNIVKTARLKDKVTIARYETIPSILNGTVWWLTDLQTRRAGLSASAELLVTIALLLLCPILLSHHRAEWWLAFAPRLISLACYTVFIIDSRSYLPVCLLYGAVFVFDPCLPFIANFFLKYPSHQTERIGVDAVCPLNCKKCDEADDSTPEGRKAVCKECNTGQKKTADGNCEGSSKINVLKVTCNKYRRQIDIDTFNDT